MSAGYGLPSYGGFNPAYGYGSMPTSGGAPADRPWLNFFQQNPAAQYGQPLNWGLSPGVVPADSGGAYWGGYDPTDYSLRNPYYAYGQTGSPFPIYNGGDFSTQVSGTLLPSSPYQSGYYGGYADGGNYYESPLALNALYQQMDVPYSDLYLDSSGWVSDPNVSGFGTTGSARYY